MNKTKMNLKHTPGPWKIKSCANGGLVVKFDDTQQIQIINEANAHLISCAPEMNISSKVRIDEGRTARQALDKFKGE